MLSTSDATATITSPAAPITVPSGSPPSVPFTITFGKDSPTGSAWLEVKAVDAANPGLVYSDATLNVTVTKPPGFLAKYLWEIIGILALIILVILALLLAARGPPQDRVTCAAWSRSSGATASRWARNLRRRASGPRRSASSSATRTADRPARLPAAGADLRIYQVRRAGHGEVRLIDACGPQPYDVESSAGPGEVMERHDGLGHWTCRRGTWRRLRSGGSAPRPAGRLARPGTGRHAGGAASGRPRCRRAAAPPASTRAARDVDMPAAADSARAGRPWL